MPTLTKPFLALAIAFLSACGSQQEKENPSGVTTYPGSSPVAITEDPPHTASKRNQSTLASRIFEEKTPQRVQTPTTEKNVPRKENTASTINIVLEPLPDSHHANQARPGSAEKNPVSEKTSIAAEEKARIEAEEKAQAAALEQARIATEEKARAKALEKARIAAEEKAKTEAREQARIAAEEKARAEALEKARIAAEEKAKAEALEEARVAAEEKARAAEKARLAAKKNKAQSYKNGKVTLPNPATASLNSPTYTPLGAERNGNIEGTIPAWTGRMVGTPQGIATYRSGQPIPNIYADEKPMFTIHAGNAGEYKKYLSAGLKALLKEYPDSFYMPIYPSHRDGRYHSLFEERTAFNQKNTRIINGIDGLEKYTGGIPFPFPQSGAEVLWNSRFAHPQPTIMGVMDDIATYPNGKKQIRRQKYAIEFPFANPDNNVGKVDDEIGINAGLVHITVEKPERQKGQMTVVHEALDQVRNDRKAWVYVPGSRRVRRAPSVGFDTPDGPGGLVTVDDSLGFNGAMERYDWRLIDKRETYIPYHNYAFDSQDVDYDTLLSNAHANPDYMRYELHRTWVVEATLKAGYNHVYGKRRFYIDEDTWQIVLLESYDGRGNLWRVGILNTLYDFAVKGYVARAQIFHDLQTGSYITLRLTNETEPSNLLGKPKGAKFYSPSNLRKMGTR